MVFVLVLSLGFILADRPELGSPRGQPEVQSPALLPVWVVPPLFHTTTDQELPSSPPRNVLTEADSEEEDEDFNVLRIVPSSSILGSAFKAYPVDLRIMAHTARDRLLVQLHRSWQLLC
jgi:hypothetical protein